MRPSTSILRSATLCSVVLVVAIAGCRSTAPDTTISTTSPRLNQPRLLHVSEDQVSNADIATLDDTAYSRPLTISTDLPEHQRELSLDEAISLAMQNTEVLRSLGAQVLRSPQSTAGSFGPSIQASDPVFGIDAALAQFDTQLSSSIDYANNDEVFNNAIIGGGTNVIQQGLATGTLGLQKVGARGTRYALRGNVIYDDNTRPSNLFRSSYTTLLELEARQPLLQGRGQLFNQVAGPNGQPGFRTTSGLLISRINNDISVVQFEQSVRDLVNEIITAYWQLHLAYHNTEALRDSTESAKETWKIVKTRYDEDLPGGEADKEAQAREQYYRFKARLVAALGTDDSGGSPGLLQAEANLRRLLNLPISDGLMLRPSDTPQVAEVTYDWESLVSTTVNQRAELREQSQRIKQRELELLASHHFVQPRLDAVGMYRNNGFGNTLGRSGNSPFDSALQTAADGLFDEWEFGVELNFPIGYRQGAAAVRNGRLQLERSRAVLREQQKQILHDLGSAVRQVDQSQVAIEIARNRLTAAEQTVAAREVAFEADAAAFDELLDAQQRLADARIAFDRESVTWAIASEGVSRESGGLLAQHGVFLNELNSPENYEVQVAGGEYERDLNDYRLSP